MQLQNKYRVLGFAFVETEMYLPLPGISSSRSIPISVISNQLKSQLHHKQSAQVSWTPLILSMGAPQANG